MSFGVWIQDSCNKNHKNIFILLNFRFYINKAALSKKYYERH